MPFSIYTYSNPYEIDKELYENVKRQFPRFGLYNDDFLKASNTRKYDGIIINPAAYTHTSVAIHDVLEIIDIPKVEVHLSEVDSREEYRKINFVRDVVDATFQGEKEVSYLKALQYLKNILNVL